MNTNTALSKQDYLTPDEFLHAVEGRFGKLRFDLAANDGQEVFSLPHFTQAQDALRQRWPLNKLCWLNPPFKVLEPWIEKCAEFGQRGGRVIVLLPASIGTEWFRNSYRETLVVGIGPRLTFKGCPTTYPKDLMLMIWGLECGFESWRWDEGPVRAEPQWNGPRAVPLEFPSRARVR